MELDDATTALLTAFASVCAVRPDALTGPVALERTRVLLRLGEQLSAVAAAAVADVEARELFVLDQAGGVRGWLRTLPCGDGQHVTRGRQLARHPQVDAAVRDGALSAAAAGTVCAQLDRVPDEVPDDQLYGVLAYGVPDLLQSWTGGLVLDDAVTEQLLARREQAAAVLRACSEDTLSAPAARLAPVFVLLARTVTPAHLPSSLQALVDALLPEQLADAEQHDHDETCVRLRKVLSGGWALHVHLDDTAGQELAELLEAKIRAMLRRPRPDMTSDAAPDATPIVQPELDPDPELDLDLDAQDDGAEDPADVTVLPWLAASDSTAEPEPEPEPGPEPDRDDVVCGPVVRSRTQRLYDAFLALLNDATAGLGRGEPRPPNLTVVTTLPALQGQPGALPALLHTARGPVPLPTDTVRRLGCDSTLSAVLLDAHGNPIGASGSHRHATARERRALRARWGPTCAVHGCTSTTVVPHHVIPWWLARRTRLEDLAPICPHHHHDIHEGHRTLRLRDGRHLAPTGWGTPTAAAA